MRRIVLLPWLLAIAAFLMLAGASPASAGTPPARLDNNGGAVLKMPAIHNLYWDSAWDADNPTLTRSSIDAATGLLVASDYFAKAAQYGITGASFTGSTTAPVGICGGTPAATLDVLTIEARVICEAEGLWLGGGPSPFNSNVLYVVYLPAGVTVSTAGIMSCRDFGAYHFAGVVGVPPVVAAFGYAIVPADCAGNLDGATVLASHEIMEAATDLVPTTAWVDNSTFDPKNIPAIFRVGEVADICSGAGAVPTPSVRLTTGVLAAPYWSNSDGGCVPTAHSFLLNASFAGAGASPPFARATLDGALVTLPFSTVFEDGGTHTFSFPASVDDPGNTFCVNTTCQPGRRWVTNDPGGTVTISANFSHTALYRSQFLLSTSASPAAAAAGDVSLTPSGYFDEGSVQTITTDPLIAAGPGERYRFSYWGFLGSTNPTTTVLMDGVKVASATYVLQEQVTFAEAGIPAGVPWTVTVNGTTHGGPFSGYFDAGSTVSFAYQAPVPGLGAGTRYALTGTSAASGFVVGAPQTVTGTYKTQYQLTFAQAGIGTGVPWTVNVNGAAQAGPFSDYFDAGSTATFAYQTPVPGLIAGTRYVLTGTSTGSGFVVSAAQLVTGTYQTQYLLTVSTGGLGANFTHISNAGTLIGTANDASPLVLWLASGTPLALSADAGVSGPGGAQLFFQGFTPAVPATLSAPFSTTAGYQSMAQLIADALANGGLSGPGANGLANSYSQKFAAVQALIAAGDHAAALNDLRAFINHVSAQSGKKLTTATATAWELDALLVYHDQLCQASAAGQINATTAAADYAFYASTATSLGSTPLPPC